jgi:hypothetical protein
MILESEGERLGTILKAQGEAQKLRVLTLGASTLDSKAITVLSLDTLRDLGDGEATKFFFPMELTRLAQGMSDYMGSGTAVPERVIADLKQLIKVLGVPEDVLGPLPKMEEIRAEMEKLSETLEEEMKESTKIAMSHENPKKA